MDLKFENLLINKYSKEMYEEMLSHAERRQIETDYIISRYLAELSKLAKKDGYIK